MKATRNTGRIVGNRLALTGAVLYLLEWVAIMGSGLVGVRTLGGEAGGSPQELLASYSGTVTGMALIAGWMAIVLAGQVLLIVGLLAGLEDSGRGHPLMEFAVVAMGISVALEVAGTAMYAGAAQLASESAPVAVLAVDRAGTAVANATFGAVGLSILCAAWCMSRSGLFPRVLNIFGYIGGAGIILLQLLTAPALLTWSIVANFSILFFWAWMIWAGILLWRHAKRRLVAPEVPEAAAPAL